MSPTRGHSPAEPQVGGQVGGQKINRHEVVGKLEANDQAVTELLLAVSNVTLSVNKNHRAIRGLREEFERQEV